MSLELLPFERYPKIPESTRGWELAPEAWRRVERLEWVVTEKIHGANCSWLIDGLDVRPARRKAILAAGEAFFGVQAVQARLRKALLGLFDVCQALAPDCLSIQLYGELFGGRYPHPDIPVVPGVEPIQTGVYYAPDIEFCAFDLAIVSPRSGEAWATDHRFVDYDVAMDCFEQVGLLYTKPLQIGRFAEVQSFPHEFPSTLPAQLGLPPLMAPNLAEGIVLKPRRGDVWIETPKGRQRPLIKRKIDAFAEDQRYHQAQKWEESSRASLQGPDAAGDPLGFLEWQMLMLATPGRLDNAISKVGALTETRREAVAVELAEDMWEALEEAHPGEVGRLCPDDVALLRAVLDDAVDALIAGRR